MKLWRCGMFVAGVLALPAYSVEKVDRLELTLKTVQADALARSEHLKAADSEVQGANARGDSQHALLWPRLSFDASYRYVTEVPEIRLPTSTMAMGDHHNYSVGLMLNWTLFDGGAIWNTWRGAKTLAASKGEEARMARRQVLLASKLAYYRVQLGIEQQRLVANSLKLAEAQHSDIAKRLKAGTSSRIDWLSAHREVLSLRLQFRNSQGELGSVLRDLFALTHPKDTYDTSSPLDVRLEAQGLDDVFEPTLIVKAEPLEALLATTKDQFTLTVKQHPQVQALAFQADAMQRTADGIRGNLWPKLMASVKSSFDYPNGPNLERIQQNSIGATLSFPIFEWSRTRSEASEKEFQSEALQWRREAAETDLKRDFQRARDLLTIYRAQKAVLARSVQESEELARLVYASYRAGRASFLEVQSANLKEFESKVQLARNDAQILMQVATLESLSTEE